MLKLSKDERKSRESEALFSLHLMSTQAAFHLCHAKQSDERILISFHYHIHLSHPFIFIPRICVVLMKMNLRPTMGEKIPFLFSSFN
jgi:hypothetical protein